MFAANAGPLAKTLFKIALGQRVSAPDPSDPLKIVRRICSPDLRVAAAKTLLAKGWPDIRAVEVSGPAGVPLTVNISLGADA